MTTMPATTGNLRRIRSSRVVIGLLLAVLTVVSLGVFSRDADASSRDRCEPTSAYAPIVGSWYAEVFFPGEPLPEVTAATMVTFMAGGGIMEVNSVNPAPAGNSGHWQRNRDCSYSVRLLVFDWDTETTGLTELADIRLRFVMDDVNHFHSTSASATVYIYDPVTGERLGGPISVPDINQTTGERLSVWNVPEAFPSQP
jgi:hypothetical protein